MTCRSAFSESKLPILESTEINFEDENITNKANKESKMLDESVRDLLKDSNSISKRKKRKHRKTNRIKKKKRKKSRRLKRNPSNNPLGLVTIDLGHDDS